GRMGSEPGEALLDAPRARVPANAHFRQPEGMHPFCHRRMSATLLVKTRERVGDGFGLSHTGNVRYSARLDKGRPHGRAGLLARRIDAPYHVPEGTEFPHVDRSRGSPDIARGTAQSRRSARPRRSGAVRDRGPHLARTAPGAP